LAVSGQGASRLRAGAEWFSASYRTRSHARSLRGTTRATAGLFASARARASKHPRVGLATRSGWQRDVASARRAERDAGKVGERRSVAGNDGSTRRTSGGRDDQIVCAARSTCSPDSDQKLGM